MVKAAFISPESKDTNIHLQVKSPVTNEILYDIKDNREMLHFEIEEGDEFGSYIFEFKNLSSSRKEVSFTIEVGVNKNVL